ncbi:MAG: hypothetical protein IPL08_11055 [Saprospiraceae bacterium]|nr:hypothetical protein [Saprospiraceae bacterium]
MKLKSSIFILFLLICACISHVDAQVILSKDLTADDKTPTKRFSLGYMAAFYYDTDGPILFPAGVISEYLFKKSNTSIDLQVTMYHPKAIHVDQPQYYSFLSEYFVQYDLGVRFYFDKMKRNGSGFYIRPSAGISTRYYRSVIYDIQQNRGVESAHLNGKEFVGLQLGFKGNINKTFYLNMGIGTLISFFNQGDKTVILLSPNLTIALGARF